MNGDQVNCWAEVVTIPTYRIGEKDKNPMFLEKRVYQGSSGVVYPHPVIDRVFDEKYEKEYTAVFLENRYLKIMILPEIGGRVQMALDKTNNYHFVYYNRVIKPALVGLAVLLPVAAQSAIYLVLLCGAALFDLYRRNL